MFDSSQHRFLSVHQKTSRLIKREVQVNFLKCFCISLHFISRRPQEPNCKEKKKKKKINRENFSFPFIVIFYFKNFRKEKRFSFSESCIILVRLKSKFSKKKKNKFSHLGKYKIILNNRFFYTLGYCIACFVAKIFFEKVVDLKILK